MKFIISGRNIDITDGLRTAVEDKLGKLERYFTADTEIIVTLSVEKERQKIEVTIPVKGNIIRSEQVSNDMYVSIDLVEEIIERQLRKYKTRNRTWKHSSRNLLKKTTKMIQTKLKSFVPKNLDLNQCIRKMHAYRWNYLDTISLYS
jgi:putative sigma-54 modulation protein